MAQEAPPMSDFLSAYSIQNWLESCPQGYLEGTTFGHASSESEPASILENPILREDAIRGTVQLVVGERAALAASSGLINSAPDEASKRFLATQTIDEARHVEIFTQRLFDLGVKKTELEDVIKAMASPHLVAFAGVLLEKVDKKDFVAGVVGQNIVLEGLAFSVFEMQHAVNKEMNPKFAHTLAGTIADERRHVGFGENRIGSLLKEEPHKKPAIEKMQKDMSYHILATFADAFRRNTKAFEEGQRMGDRQRELTGAAPGKMEWQGANLAELAPAEMEQLLAATVLKEFKIRLDRLGLEYQTPTAP
jgi:hypothetical protein